MRKNDLAYIAGLFDAEGSVSIDRWREKSAISMHHSLCISLTSTNRPILNWLKKNFGGYIRIVDKKKKNICFQWEAKINIAANFLQNTLPYLRIKKAQAKLGLQLQKEIKKNVGYNRVTPESLQRREQFRNRLLLLNRKSSPNIFSNEYKITYVAGLLDGDGSIFISIQKRRVNPLHYLRIDISSANRSIVYWLKDNFDGLAFPKGLYYSWIIERNHAENFLHKISPHLRIKKPQAKLAFQFRKEKKRQTPGKRLIPEILERRERFRQQMKALNHNS